MSQANAQSGPEEGALILIGGDEQAVSAVTHRLAALDATRPIRHLQSGDLAPPDLQLADATLIHLAEVTSGDAAALAAGNCDVPLAWAQRAAREGAARFVLLSSFSVYGAAQSIDLTTPIAPTTDYGRARLAGEEAVRAAGLGDRLTILRVPALVGVAHDKLAQLVRLVERTGIVPAAPWPTPRSMLGYDGLATTIAALVAENRGGTFLAADPLPFSPGLLVAAMHSAGKGARQLTVPRGILAALRRFAPGLHASLFEPSLLASDSNVAAVLLPFEQLDRILGRLAQSRVVSHTPRP